MSAEDGYSTIAAEHTENPRNMHPMSSFDGHARVTGPCGDTMEFWVKVRDGNVEKAGFVTDGCGPSRACGSMATCLAEGRSIERVSATTGEEILGALGGLPDEVRHCALLAADTLKAACRDFYARSKPAGDSAGPGGGREAGGAQAGRPSAGTGREAEDRRQIDARMSRVRRKIIVLSGKGGVGKSTVAVNLSVGLVKSGKRVGLLDADIHGPSTRTMLGLENMTVGGTEGEITPVEAGGLKVVSLAFFLESPDDAVIWRGPMKMAAIKQFIKDVAWGDLDFLVIDLPPGTGDEPLSVVQLLGKVDGAVVVTTPQRVAAVEVRKSVTFCRRLGVPVIGVVENMSGFACPRCGQVTTILRGGAGVEIARDMAVPFLGSIPVDPELADSCDSGHAFVDGHATSKTAEIIMDIIRKISEVS